MKKILTLLLATVCTTMLFAANSGVCGTNLNWEFDHITGILSFSNDYTGEATMNDFANKEDAPWYPWRNEIKDIMLGNFYSKIGKNAFRDIPNLKYVIMNEPIKQIGDSAFFGCENLKVLETRVVNPPTVAEHSLFISNTEVITFVICAMGADASIYQTDSYWSQTKVSQANGEYGSVYWDTKQSDSLGSLKLQIDRHYELSPDTIVSIPDMHPGEAPWHSLSGATEDLWIGNGIGYIGENAFADFNQLQTISLGAQQNAIDSIHYNAFPHDVQPWKFALEFDPKWENKSINPPKVVGYHGEALPNFAHTVLYVPDSIVNMLDSTKSMDLYKAHDFWGKFGVVTDHSVSGENITKSSALLSWYPLEHTERYILGVVEDGKTDTVYCTIIADKQHGLVMDSISGKNLKPIKPKNDGGGTTLMISLTINTTTGQSSDESIEVSGDNLKKSTRYNYSMSAILYNGGEVAKMGSFVTLDDDETIVVPITIDNSNSPKYIYDMSGRYVGADENQLPMGTYIIKQGANVQKIAIKK